MDFFERYYSQIWRSIIRPPREHYARADLGTHLGKLGSTNFELNGRTYRRQDIVMKNKRKKCIECSFYRLKHQEDVLPVVVYLHGNSSSRLSGIQYLEHLLPEVNVFTVDLSGSGRSEGQYISLGYQEKEDVRGVVRYLRQEHQVQRILLWGRSMGAATAILYAAKYQNIEGLVLDSSFADLQTLIIEIADAQVSLPEFVVRFCLDHIRDKVKELVQSAENYELDILKLKPLQEIQKINVPVYFLAGKNDKMVKPSHTQALFKKCSSTDKHLELFEGGHNGKRPLDTLLRVEAFVKKVLLKGGNQTHENLLNELDINTEFDSLLETSSKILRNKGVQDSQHSNSTQYRRRIFGGGVACQHQTSEEL